MAQVSLLARAALWIEAEDRRAALWNEAAWIEAEDKRGRGRGSAVHLKSSKPTKSFLAKLGRKSRTSLNQVEREYSLRIEKMRFRTTFSIPRSD